MVSSNAICIHDPEFQGELGETKPTKVVESEIEVVVSTEVVVSIEVVVSNVEL